MRLRGALLLLLTLLTLGCSRDTLDKEEWQRMSHADRVLYVKSLIGAEKAKDAKGGEGKTFDRPAEDYVTEIDRAYARGDAREADQIFAELGR
jgi:hypothetical protein